jgi:hypothetical protein
MNQSHVKKLLIRLPVSGRINLRDEFTVVVTTQL